MALPTGSCAHDNFFKVNDDSLNAGWASNTTYRDTVLWPGDNSAAIQLSWGASYLSTMSDILVTRLDVVGRAGTVQWARQNQLGSSSLIAVSQMRGATLRNIVIDDVVVYDDMPTLLGVSLNVGNPAWGFKYPGGVPLGKLLGWRVSNVTYRAAEIGVGYRTTPSTDQIPLIQTGKSIKSWVYFAAPDDGSVVDITFSDLRIGTGDATCITSAAAWPGMQVVGPADMTFHCV